MPRSRPGAGRTLCSTISAHSLCTRPLPQPKSITQEMLADAARATEADPKHWLGWYYRCAAAQELRSYPSAVKFGKKAVETGPNQLSAHLALARALRKNDDHSKALKHYEQAIALSSNGPVTRALLMEHGDCDAERPLCPRAVRLFLWGCAVLCVCVTLLDHATCHLLARPFAFSAASDVGLFDSHSVAFY
jgi:tetratricopeptide (TPR) repeat protein